jgi:hypothetical protein
MDYYSDDNETGPTAEDTFHVINYVDNMSAK